MPSPEHFEKYVSNHDKKTLKKLSLDRKTLWKYDSEMINKEHIG